MQNSPQKTTLDLQVYPVTKKECVEMKISGTILKGVGMDARQGIEAKGDSLLLWQMT